MVLINSFHDTETTWIKIIFIRTNRQYKWIKIKTAIINSVRIVIIIFDTPNYAINFRTIKTSHLNFRTDRSTSGNIIFSYYLWTIYKPDG